MHVRGETVKDDVQGGHDYNGRMELTRGSRCRQKFGTVGRERKQASVLANRKTGSSPRPIRIRDRRRPQARPDVNGTWIAPLDPLVDSCEGLSRSRDVSIEGVAVPDLLLALTR